MNGSVDQRLAFANDLLAARDRTMAKPLASVVGANLMHLWEAGGRRTVTRPPTGRRPTNIFIRPNFIRRESGDPVLPKLIKSKGLQLRLELLMLFDAQCRSEPGKQAAAVHTISPTADQRYDAWSQLVLSASTPTQGSGRGPAALRARQITEALRALEDQHLVNIPRESGGVRRSYAKAQLRSEDSTADQEAPYVVPTGGVAIPSAFFLNLWVFALTDAELATYLALRWLRWAFGHQDQGVFIVAADREAYFGLKEASWRSHRMLHSFGLVDRARDQRRVFKTGKILHFPQAWKKREVLPYHFSVRDEALDQPALDVIHRVLANPTPADLLREEFGFNSVPDAPDQST
jgi:hypothetical protein